LSTGLRREDLLACKFPADPPCKWKINAKRLRGEKGSNLSASGGSEGDGSGSENRFTCGKTRPTPNVVEDVEKRLAQGQKGYQRERGKGLSKRKTASTDYHRRERIKKQKNPRDLLNQDVYREGGMGKIPRRDACRQDRGEMLLCTPYRRGGPELGTKERGGQSAIVSRPIPEKVAAKGEVLNTR